MTPDFRIIADSEDITERIRDRLLSFRVTDEAGTKSDAVELVLDDGEAVLVWPSPGAELEVSLGYRETGLTRLGLYVVDEVEHSGPPNTLMIRAKATNMRASLKAPKTRAWDNIKLGNLVATMASEHGISPKVSGGLSTVVIPHLDQTAESDLHLLTRLARMYGAVTKPVAGNLIFVFKGEAKSASGRELTEVAVPTSHVIQHRMTLAERGSYQSAIAYWHDPVSAKRVPGIGRKRRANIYFTPHPIRMQNRPFAPPRLS